ncbi:hypothetical protein HGG64_02510 [Mycoplasma phocoeninasale]|uniref:Chromosome segregation protein SMC n=1 Tax=Mycoplasma phocoeninasale TaxID=2726117 RepID=A0A858U2C2_9MOLU|nr:hypothetical protein [Mycoplasma phocoeninasale]QJG66562.1 hypothetical protein HGG64_02510 [Mycoplasma phocoeninasale]
MNSLKSKNKKIILSITTGVFILSTITVASLYAKYNSNRDDIIKDPKTGLTKEEEQKVRRYDPNNDEDFEKIRKYIIKVIKVLQRGTKNALKQLQINDYKIGIAYLEEAISFGRGATIIVNRAIEVSLRNDKKVLLREDRDALNGTLKEAVKALEIAKTNLRKLIQYQAIVNEEIEKLTAAITKADEAVTIPEFQISVDELGKLIIGARGIEAKAREMLLFEEADKLAKLISQASTKQSELQAKINSQSSKDQRESVRIFVAGLPEKISRLIEKSNKAIASVDMENVLKEINDLIISANKVKEFAKSLGLTPESDKIAAGVKQLEDEKDKLQNRLNEKNRTNMVLKDETKKIISELQKHIADAENTVSLDDLTNLISKLSSSIEKGNEIRSQLEREKLSKELTELKDTLSEARRTLEDVQSRKKDKEDQIKAEKENITKIIGDLDKDYSAANIESQKITGDTATLRKFKSTLELAETTYSRLTAETNDIKKYVNTETATLKAKIDELKTKLQAVEQSFAKNQAETSKIYIDKLLSSKNLVFYDGKPIDANLKTKPASSLDKTKDKFSVKYNGGPIDLDTKVDIELDYGDISGILYVKVNAERFGIKKSKIFSYAGFETLPRLLNKLEKKDYINLTHTGGINSILNKYGDFGKFLADFNSKTPTGRVQFLKENGFSIDWKFNDLKVLDRNLTIDSIVSNLDNSFTIKFTTRITVRNVTNESTFGNQAYILELIDKKGEASITLK